MKLLDNTPITAKDMQEFGQVILAQASQDNRFHQRARFQAGNYQVSCANNEIAIAKLGYRLSFAKKYKGLMETSPLIHL